MICRAKNKRLTILEQASNYSQTHFSIRDKNTCIVSVERGSKRERLTLNVQFFFFLSFSIQVAGDKKQNKTVLWMTV